MSNPTAAVIGGTDAGKALHLERLGVETRGHTAADFEDVELSGVDLTAADLAFVAVTDSARGALPRLREAGVPLWVDLHHWNGEPSELHDPFVEAGSCLFLSDVELDNPLRTAERLLPGKELVVLTHGKRGATAFFPDSEPFFVLPYVAGPLVDTRGAGDAFCAGTAYGRLLGWDWPRALRAGAVVAGGCVAVPEPVDPALTREWLASRL